jgi:anti-anti-sigma factor
MSAPSSRWLEVEEVGSVTVVRVTARRILTEEAVEAVGRQLNALVAAPGCKNVVLQLNAVEGITTMMVGKLLGLHRQMQASGGRLVLCGAGPVIGEVLSLLRVAQVIPVYGGEQEALQSFS